MIEVQLEGCIYKLMFGYTRYMKDCAIKGDDEYGE